MNSNALDRFITGNYGQDEFVTTCPECGYRVQSDEDACPHCGTPMEED